MKCSICGSELDYGSSICKYCGNVETVPEPEIVSEKEPEDIDLTRTYNIHKERDNSSGSEGTGAVLPEIPDKPPVYTPPADEEPAGDDDEPENESMPERDEEDMSKRKTNSRRKREKHPVRTALIMVLAMIIIFAVTFSIFFHLLGGSFTGDEEPTDTPAPTETLPVVTAQSAATKAPTEKPAASPTKAPKKQTATQAPEKTKEPEPEPEATEDTRTSDYLFNSSRNVIRQSELEARSREEIKLIYYEIYARHGYDFQDEGLKEYFSGKTWYEPVTSHREAAEAEFNVVERENIEVIEAYQRQQGWRQ
ncbi:MAG: YARHG domain-containing protein [Candidatus Ornithomonoglobus sp.]